MSLVNRINGDMFVAGNIGCLTFTPPTGSIPDSAIAPLAGIDATKLQHQHRIIFNQPNTTATTETRVIHVVIGATGTIIDFRAGAIVAPLTTATVTIDLKKSTGGGAFASVLSSVITLDNANVDRVPEAATISATGLVVGDVLEIVVTAAASGGTLPTGLFAALTINEKAQ